jgi:hypothetical protein
LNFFFAARRDCGRGIVAPPTRIEKGGSLNDRLGSFASRSINCAVDLLSLRPETGLNVRALASVVKGQELKGSWAGS